MAGRRVWLDICMGDSKKVLRDQDAYDRTRLLLDKHAASYGLPSKPKDLADWQKEILQSIDTLQGHETPLLFEPPEPLLAGRLVFELSASSKLAKTTANFVALCAGEKGTCKYASNRNLHYLECPIRRIVKGFIAQGGDILRGDGSGGESIYEAILKLRKPQLKKLKGQYVIFGQLKDGTEPLRVLDRLSEVGSDSGKPLISVWIGDCGACQSD